MKNLLLAFVSLLLLTQSAASEEEPITQERFPSRLLIEEFDEPLGAAESSSVRELIRLAVEVIKHFEGWRSIAYDDPVGYCTIGYGHLIGYGSCVGFPQSAFTTKELSPLEGDALLITDTRGARRAVRELTNTPLDDNQFGALTSFVFNVGKTNFEKSKLLKRINQEDYDSAADEFKKWIHAKGRVFDGLVERRGCEESLFRGTLDPDGDGKFSRADCRRLGAAPTASEIIDIETGESQ